MEQEDLLQYLHLLEKAERACDRSYSPYSNYRVGCAVETELGVFQGANVENASYNLGICAERAAMTVALMHGAKEIRRIAVCCRDAKHDEDGNVVDAAETMPCGGCRQWMMELAPDAMVMTNGMEEPVSVRDLLPESFRLG